MVSWGAMLSAAHQRHFQFGVGVAGDAHVFVQFHAHHHAVVVAVVVVDVAHRAHGVAVGVDEVRHGQSFDVLKLHIVGVARLKDVDAFQKVDAHKQQRHGGDGSEGDFYLIR